MNGMQLYMSCIAGSHHYKCHRILRFPIWHLTFIIGAGKIARSEICVVQTLGRKTYLYHKIMTYSLHVLFISILVLMETCKSYKSHCLFIFLGAIPLLPNLRSLEAGLESQSFHHLSETGFSVFYVKMVRYRVLYKKH